MRIIIDSHPIIWGIKRTATEGQEKMIQISKDFFKWADDNKHQIIVPTVVIAEILTPEDETSASAILAEIDRACIVVPFDFRCAKVYAELMRGRFGDLKEYRKTNGIRNDKMKFDHIIVSTAKAHNCDKIVSNDPDVRGFANGVINVVKIEDSFSLPGEQQVLDIFQ